MRTFWVVTEGGQDLCEALAAGSAHATDSAAFKRARETDKQYVYKVIETAVPPEGAYWCPRRDPQET